MTKQVIIIICLLFLAPVVSLSRAEPLANKGKRGLYARSVEQVLRLEPEEIDLATAALIASEQWSQLVQGRRYLARLDDMAYEIRDILKAGKLKANYKAIPVINEYLFQKQGFQSVKKPSGPNDLFLDIVMDRKKGYCLSLSILYLSLAERLGLPLYGVAVPGHFFVRYDDGHVRFNIETTSKGGTASDEHYIKKFNVPVDFKDNIYMTNLDKTQTVGCLFNNLGNTYYDIGDIETALAVLEEAVEINPSLPESRMNLGNIYLKKGRIEDAIYEYKTALQVNPNDAKAHLNLGNAYSEKGWLSSAIEQYNLSLRLDPNIIETYKNLASAYCKRRMFLRAKQLLKQAIAAEPKNAGLYSRLGDVYMRIDDYEKAISLHKKALTIEPGLAESYYGLGMCYNKQGLLDEEIKAFEKALTLEPYLVGALVNLGNAYTAKGKNDAAIEQYTKAVQIKPDDATIYYNFGTAYTNMGNFQEAVTLYEKAVELDPDMGDAHNGLAYSYYRSRKYDLAIKHLRAAEKLGIEIDNKLLAAIEKKLK